MVLIFGEVKANEKYFTPVKEKIEKKWKEVSEKRRWKCWTPRNNSLYMLKVISVGALSSWELS